MLSTSFTSQKAVLTLVVVEAFHTLVPTAKINNDSVNAQYALMRKIVKESTAWRERA